jgi:hypothetical protein
MQKRTACSVAVYTRVPQTFGFKPPFTFTFFMRPPFLGAVYHCNVENVGVFVAYMLVTRFARELAVVCWYPCQVYGWYRSFGGGEEL